MHLRWRRLPVAIAGGLIAAWRYGVSPVLAPSCRYWPSCSEYGQEALARHGALRGGWLTVARVARCHPWNPGGVDPVPDTFEPPAAARYLGQVLGRRDRCDCAPSRAAGTPNPLPPR